MDGAVGMPTTETTAGGTARDVLWMVWASGAVGMPATSAGNDPPPPLSGVSRMIEPMTAFDLRRCNRTPGRRSTRPRPRPPPEGPHGTCYGWCGQVVR